MATSVFLARFLGPLLLAVGAGILINPKPFHTMAGEVVRSITLVYLFGLADFAAGLAIVLTHNVWVANWRVLITLIGWLMLIRGAVRILARVAKPDARDGGPRSLRDRGPPSVLAKARAPVTP